MVSNQMTPAASNANISHSENPRESLDSRLDSLLQNQAEDVDALLQIKSRKQTIPVSSPNSPSLSMHHQSGIASPTYAGHNGTVNGPTFKMVEREAHKDKGKEEKQKERQPVAECTMKEVMQHVANLTSEVCVCCETVKESFSEIWLTCC